jgi:NitT/TauT family transport system permease protein
VLSNGALFAIRGSPSRTVHLSLVLASFVMFIASWFWLAGSGLYDDVFMPSPLVVADRMYDWAVQDALLDDISISIYRVSIAFFLAAIMAVPLALMIGTFKPVQSFFEPLIEFSRYLPAVAFVPLILLWIGIGENAKISVIWLGTFFQMVLLLADDFRSVPISQIEAAQTMGATRKEIVQLVISKSALPAVVDTLRITLGWAWTYLVVAELVAAQSGLGYQILKAQRYLQTDTIFAGIIIIGILGLIMDQLFRLIHRRSFPWLYQ